MSGDPFLLGGSACGVSLDYVYFAKCRSFSEQSASLPGRLFPASAPLADYFTGFPCSFTRTGGFDGLPDDRLCNLGMFFKVAAQLFVKEGLDRALDIRIELALGLPLELRLGQLDGDDGDQTFAYIVSGELSLEILDQIGRLRVTADGLGKR